MPSLSLQIYFLHIHVHVHPVTHELGLSVSWPGAVYYSTPVISTRGLPLLKKQASGKQLFHIFGQFVANTAGGV